MSKDDELTPEDEFEPEDELTPDEEVAYHDHEDQYGDDDEADPSVDDGPTEDDGPFIDDEATPRQVEVVSESFAVDDEEAQDEVFHEEADEEAWDQASDRWEEPASSTSDDVAESELAAAPQPAAEPQPVSEPEPEPTKTKIEIIRDKPRPTVAAKPNIASAKDASEQDSQRPSAASQSRQPAGDGVLVESDDVMVRFGGQTVLKDINLQIRRGQTVAIIGESGCGKTVFMKTIVGLISPTKGRLGFDGRWLADMSHEELTDTRRRFGFVFQNAALFDSMSIFDNVAFPLRQNESVAESEVRDRVMTHLAEVGLPAEVSRKRPAELSGGMRKRVGLARALILRPELVVYDEPTTGLDPIMSDVINELILDTRRRYPVTSVVVTHDMNTARKVADRVLMFYPRMRLDDHESQVLFDGPPSDLEHAEDRRVRQFVRGEAGERINEMRSA